MRIRTGRIWLSRGWYRIVCSVSLLLLPLFCGKSDVFAAMVPAQQEAGDSVSVKKGDVITGIVRKKDGTPFPGVKISQLRDNIMPGVKVSRNDSIKAPIVITDENGLFSLTVSDASDKFYLMHNGCAIEDFYLDRHSYDVILFDNYKDFFDEYPCLADSSNKDKPHRSNVPGVIASMVAIRSTSIDVYVPKDTTLTRLTQEMIDRVRAIELEQEQKNKK
jgi:hypothetical protein